MKISHTILCYLLLLITSCFSIHAVHADEVGKHFDLATVDFVKGYATIYPANKTEKAIFAKRGMKIIEKDFIITGDNGFISLSFSTGTVVNIQPSSEVIMEKIDCKKNSKQCRLALRALKGNLTTNVESHNGHNSQFTIETPYASAAVRGTIFDIDVNDDRLLAGVTEGQVNISSTLGTVELPENFGTQVQSNQPPSTPKPLLSAPAIIPGPVRYESTGELAWNSVAMATKYLISLSNTSGLVYSRQLTNTLHSLQNLDVGSYAAQIRAIDNDGFKGLVTEHEFDVVETDNSKSGPSLITAVNATGYSLVIKSQNTAAIRTELQFSATKDFEKPVNLDVNAGEEVSSYRADNSVYVRGRDIINSTTVSPYGPVVEVPGKI